MSGNPCLILEVSGAQDWGAAFPPDRGARQVAGMRPVVIPDARQPAILQPNREVAETEAKRLALAHPQCRFMVFEASTVAMVSDVPSHITVKGEVWLTRKVAVLAEIDDDQVPF